jgi:hypothetical protein
MMNVVFGSTTEVEYLNSLAAAFGGQAVTQIAGKSR